MFLAVWLLRLPDHHEARRIGIRQRPDQRPIDHAEDGGVCADAEGERQHCHHSKAAIFDEHSKAEAQVVPQDLERADTVVLMHALENPRDTSQLEMSSASRFVGRHAPLDVLLCLCLQIVFEFATRFFVAFSAKEEATPRHVLLHCRLEDAIYSAHQLLPTAGLLRELFTSCGG